MSIEQPFPLPLDILLGAFDQSDFAIGICDSSGHMRWANDAFMRLTGYPIGDLLALPHWGVLIHESDRERVRTTNAQRVAGGQVPSVYDMVFQHRDGRAIPVEASVRTLRTGEDTWILAVVRDVSIRKDSERRARHLANVVDSISDAVVSVSIDGLITSWNPSAERLFGYRADEVMGKPIGILAPDTQDSDVAQLLARVQSGETIAAHDAIRRHRSGATVHVSLSAAPVFDEVGQPVGFAGMYRDISDRRRAEEERRRRDEADRVRAGAEESSRLKSEFLASMSHEIRTPMNGVIGMTTLLLDTPLSAEQRELTETIARSAETLLTVINDILDFSKIEAGRLELENVEFDLPTLVEEVAEMSSAAADEKGLELLVRLDENLPAIVRGDSSRIRQVLINLVGNAVKFTESGEVLVGVGVSQIEAGGSITFEVHDTGPGIPAELLPRLFREFSQGDTGMSRRHAGTGLGLSISQRLVRLMGGSIGVDSRPGAGSNFWFRLPLPVVSHPLPRRRNLTGRRALVVDDVATNLWILSSHLSAWGMAAVTAGSGKEALRLARSAAASRKPFDVVITDFLMPGMDGVDLAHALAAEHPRPPVLVLSSAGGRESARGRAGADVTSFLTKPVRRAHLLQALEDALAGQRVAVGSTERTSAARVGSGLHVLVVDDNEINLRLATLLLERTGYTVTSVGDGGAALAALDAAPFDAVLLDCEMPGMTGYETAAEIRRREAAGTHIPILAVTASAMKGDAERALAAGMDAHIPKPIDRDRLDRILADLIRDHPRAPAASPVPASAPHVEAAGFEAAGFEAAGFEAAGFEAEGFEAAGFQRADRIDARALEELRSLDGSGEATRTLVAMFLEDAPRILDRIADAAHSEDAGGVRAGAHNLKGSAATFGARSIARVAERWERDAASAVLPSPQDVAGLRQELAAVRRLLERYVDGQGL